MKTNISRDIMLITPDFEDCTSRELRDFRPASYEVDESNDTYNRMLAYTHNVTSDPHIYATVYYRSIEQIDSEEIK